MYSHTCQKGEESVVFTYEKQYNKSNVVFETPQGSITCLVRTIK